jgi:hypothetical protein
MDTSKWGPPLWQGIHAIAHGYDPEIHDPNHYRIFFHMLGKVLPCKYCRQSFQQYMIELPVEGYLLSQEDLTFWLYSMHNKVNEKLRNQGLLNKPDPSFESIYNRYDKWRANCAVKTCKRTPTNDQCSAKTKKGRQCTKKRAQGKRRCVQHCK